VDYVKRARLPLPDMLFMMALLVAAALALAAPLTLAWRMLILGALVVVAGYDFVDVVGSRLNAHFDQVVAAFITGERDRLTVSPEVLIAFSRLLFVLLPLLLYSMGFGLYAALMLSVLGFALIQHVPELTFPFFFPFVSLLSGTAVAILIGLYRLTFPRYTQPVGLRLSETHHEPLWKLTREVAAAIGTEPIYETHPPIGVRMQYARRCSVAEGLDDRPATSLFDEWDALDQQASEAYHDALLANWRY
jgi:hypothetical protein